MVEILRTIRWFLFNSMIAGTVYMGLIKDIEGLKNIAIFLCWAIIIISFFLVFSDEARERLQEKFKDKKAPVPKWFNALWDIVISLFLVWFGYWFTAIVDFIHTIIQH